MKTLSFLLILLNFISCQNSTGANDTQDEVQQISTVESKSPKIQLDGLDNHPNKEQMEWLLNNYKEEFIVSIVDGITFNQEELILKEYYFHTKSSNISLILFFCDHQEDCLQFAEANFPPVAGQQTTGVNGSVLFVVQGVNPYDVNDVLSWLAGEE